MLGCARPRPMLRRLAVRMYLTHNGVVRATPKAEVRGVETDGVAPGP